jgi:ABC-type nitrate/sulfonate/bicarbonate transport system substrate-binding protein
LRARTARPTIAVKRIFGEESMRFTRGLAGKGIALLAGAVLATTLAGADGASAADKLRVGKGVPFAFTFVPMEVGVAAGIWAKHGIEPEIYGFGGAARQQQALVAGSIDIGLGSGPSMGFTVKGVPAVGIAAFAGPPRSLAVVVLPNSPIKTSDHLKGRTIGITTAGSLTDWLSKRISLSKGWGVDGIKPVALGGLEPSLAALKTSQVDSLMLATEVGYLLEKKNEARIVVGVGEFVKDFHTHVMFAQNSLIKEKPELVQRFVNAWFDTIAYMKANKAFSVEVATKALRQDRDIMARTYDEEMPMMSDDGVFDPKAVAVIKASLVEMKILDSIPKDEQMFTTRFVPPKR